MASFFVSRIDASVDPVLATDSPLRGRIAIANAQRAYARNLEHHESARWKRLAAHAARPQRVLWASTGTKDPDYSDVRYVEGLVAPGVVNTMPLATLRAFADHGDTAGSLGADPRDAERLIGELDEAGVDLGALTNELERRGVEWFQRSYDEALSGIDALVGQEAARPTEHVRIS